MLSLKRWMYVAFMVVTVSSIFILYSINQERTRNIQIKNTHISDNAAMAENTMKRMSIEERNSILSDMQEDFTRQVRNEPDNRDKLSEIYQLLKQKCWEALA